MEFVVHRSGAWSSPSTAGSSSAAAGRVTHRREFVYRSSSFIPFCKLRLTVFDLVEARVPNSWLFTDDVNTKFSYVMTFGGPAPERINERLASTSVEEGRGKVAALLKQQGMCVKGMGKSTPANEEIPPLLEGGGKMEVS
ncbi:putative villin-3-like isoform X1 [Sesbania bispinosa]|nr:putative villin-3-like isoform X1 [Sesbania bispinosa]